MDRNNILELRHLSKNFGDNEILRDINMNVEKGEVVSIIGSSGSGKSTMLRCINLLEQPTGGDIIFQGSSILDKNFNENIYRSKVGMVFQQFNLFNNMTILKNCVIGQVAVKKVDEKTAIDKAKKYLDSVGMAEYLDAKPHQISGGQKQRVAIARMLLQNTPIMVFDDSLSAVDSETDAKIRAALKTNRKSATTILISHRITTLMQADTIMVLDKGKIVDIGTHEELIRREGIYKDIYDVQMNMSDIED